LDTILSDFPADGHRSSALIAILSDEPEAPGLEAAIEADSVRLLSAASLVEASIVIESRYGEAGGRELDLLVREAGIEVVAVSPEQAELARAAYRRFGRGRHPAGLNFGDCFSYALSVATDEPLLFKGDDFSKTDIHTVELPSLGGR
jgi:ribonuclease VapC